MKQADGFLLSSLFQNDLATAFRQLRSGSVNLFAMRDAKNYTPLHLAALNNQSAAVVFLLKYASDFCSEDQLFGWVNARSIEGFTCLHLAAFRGNLVRPMQFVVKRLLEFGADMWAVSQQGLSVMHVAAQGDQPLIIAFFQSLGLPSDSLDNREGSPLHWAAYLSSEQATNLLLAWRVDVNRQDADLQTPLHLATLSGNARIVRNLLLSGSSRDVEDKEGRTPKDIAVQNNLHNIEDLLKPPKRCADFGMRPPLRPYEPSRLILLVYLVFFSFVFAVNRVWIGPSLPNSFVASSFLDLFTAVSAISLITFIIVVFKDPGYLRSAPGAKVLVKPRQELLENYDSLSVCPECVLVKPPRSRHCQCCNRCVAKFDHHCPWINNCVGGGNLGWFYMYITSTWLFVLLGTGVGAIVLWTEGVSYLSAEYLALCVLVLMELLVSVPLL